MNQRQPLVADDVGSPVGDLSYTEASRELDEIVAFFEQREVDVDLLVARLERATAIVDELDRRLRRTRAQVEELVPRLESATMLPPEREAAREAGGGTAGRASGLVDDVGAVDVEDPDDADEEQFDDRTHADAERGEDGAPAMSRDAREHADPGQLPDDHPGLF